MRILLVSDLHYTLPQLDWVVSVAPSFELVVLAGDQLDISSPVALNTQSVVILRYLSLLQAAGRALAQLLVSEPINLLLFAFDTLLPLWLSWPLSSWPPHPPSSC